MARAAKAMGVTKAADPSAPRGASPLAIAEAARQISIAAK